MCRQVFTSSMHTTAHQMISRFFIYRTKTAAKCAKIEHAHAKRAELFFLGKYVCDILFAAIVMVTGGNLCLCC